MALEFDNPVKPGGKRAISDQEVLRYRIAYQNGEMTSREIARNLGVAKETVMRMLRGDTYQHVGMTLKEEILQMKISDSERRMVEMGLVTNPDGSKTTMEQYLEMKAKQGMVAAADVPEPVGNGMDRLQQEMSRHPDILLKELSNVPANPLDE